MDKNLINASNNFKIKNKEELLKALNIKSIFLLNDKFHTEKVIA